MSDFNLDEALADAEKRAEGGAHAAKVKITNVAGTSHEEGENRKLFQNKKANIAIGITFGVICVAIILLLVL